MKHVHFPTVINTILQFKLFFREQAVGWFSLTRIKVAKNAIKFDNREKWIHHEEIDAMGLAAGSRPG